MTFSLNTNAASMNIVANLALSQTEMHKAMERVSSGLRVVNAADDAAGMALHSSLQGEIKGAQQAVRNAQDAVSFLQTADGALAEITHLIQRAYQVALTQENTIANPTGSDGYIAATAELAQLNTAITYLKTNTYFGLASNTVLGTAGNIAASAVGANTLSNTASAGYATVTVISSSATALTELSVVSALRAKIGGTQAAAEGVISSSTTWIANLQAADSRVADADMASEISNVTRLSILGQAGTAMLAQANSSNQSVLKLLQ